MNNQWLILPILLQFILTFIIWITMYRTRINLIKKERIHPQNLTNRQQTATRLAAAAGPADNFSNQFELPVIFYVTLIVFISTQWAGWFEFYIALIFVLLRGVHAFIHITYNRVRHRFYAYVVSSVFMWLLVAT